MNSTKKIHIFADSTCDLTEELIQKYHLTIIPLCIILEDKSYYDGTELTPAQIFKWADEHKKTPKTAAITFEWAEKALKPCLEAGDDVIFFGISEDMSTTCNVMRLAAEEFETGSVFVINSLNLSTGIALQAIRAAEMAAAGTDTETIVAQIEAARDRVCSSFVVDTLTYLARGGRCSGATALLGNALKLHPCIVVQNGRMEVAKKYRGSLNKVVLRYVKDLEPKLMTADPSRIFITHSGAAPEVVEEVREYLSSLGIFENIYETRTGGVVSSHCGPGTLGVLFYRKQNKAE